jgi:hypothetical protein
MNISAIALATFVGVVCIGVGRLSVTRFRGGNSDAPKVASSTTIDDPQKQPIRDEQHRDAVLVERELAKLMATLSAAGLAALAALGQAKMIGTVVMTFSITGLLVGLVGGLGVFSQHHAMALDSEKQQKLHRRVTAHLTRSRLVMIFTLVLVAYASTATMVKCDRAVLPAGVITYLICSPVAEILRS